MESSLKSSIEAVLNRVERLEAKCGSPPARKWIRAESHRHWTDCDITVDYSAAVWWPPSNDEEDMEEGSEECARGTPKAIKLSKANVTLISSTFTSVLPNTERQKIRDAFPTTELAEMHCLHLDPLFRTSSVKQEAKTADAELARVWALIHVSKFFFTKANFTTLKYSVAFTRCVTKRPYNLTHSNSFDNMFWYMYIWTAVEILESISSLEKNTGRQMACSIKFWTLISIDVQKLYSHEQYVHRKF